MTLTLLVVGLLAQGGPPLRTDDPGTPGDGRWEINVAVTLESVGDSRLFEAPLLDVNYGLGNRLQLKVELPWLVAQGDGTGESGLGKPLLGVKWRFVDADEAGVSISVYPQLELNAPRSSREEGLVERGTDLLWPVQAQVNLGPLEANAELGYLFREKSEDEWVFGLAFGAPVEERLELIGEVHAESRLPIKREDVLVNAGCRCGISKDHVLLFSIGRDLSDKPNLTVYLGMQFNL